MATHKSGFAVAETLRRLRALIQMSGSTIFATIDQSAAAAAVGLTLRPTTLIIFGNPKGGTPLMDAFPLMALDLPLKILVWEEGGVVYVAYPEMAEIAKRSHFVGMDERIAAMDAMLTDLANSVVQA